MNRLLLAFLLLLTGSVSLLTFIAHREVTVRAEESSVARVPRGLVIANPQIMFASDRSPYMRDER
jgi:hypothetical protein